MNLRIGVINYIYGNISHFNISKIDIYFDVYGFSEVDI
jgi:hypothetical protein